MYERQNKCVCGRGGDRENTYVVCGYPQSWLQAVVSYPTWVLENKGWSYARVISTLKH